MSAIISFRHISFLKAVYLNCKFRTGGIIIPFAGSKFSLSKESKIICSDGARFFINTNNKMRRARISTIRLDEGATLFVRGHFSLFYNCDIVVFPGGKLQFGSGYINSDLKLRCADRITIGDDVAISHDVTILDSDHHALGGKPIATSPVSIGNHVWIGTRATILQGVEIGGGCIVAAGAVVTKSMPPNSLIAGVPAKVIKENISWE